MMRALRRSVTRTRRWLLGCIGVNPYEEGTFGSYRWKMGQGKPLSPEELRSTDRFEALQDLSEDMEAALVRSGGLLRRLDLYEELLDSLPKAMLDELRATEPPEFGSKLADYLNLASYRRERTTTRVAGIALIISTLAFLVSLATLGVAVWTLRSSNIGPETKLILDLIRPAIL